MLKLFYLIMGNLIRWFIILLILNECTCTVEDKCFNTAKISVIMNFRTKICEEILNNTLQEPDNYLIQKYNYKRYGLKVEIMYLDTCGDDKKTLESVFKTILWADNNCLHPPYFLGFIGPDESENLNLSLRITDSLRIPHITGIPSTSIYVHKIVIKEDDILLKGIFELIKLFGWKSFIFKSNVQNSFFENIANRFAIEAATKNLCLLSTTDTSSHIVHIGNPDDKFLTELQESSIILISDNGFEKEMKNINSTNSILLLDYIRIEKKQYEANDEELKWLEINLLKQSNNTGALHLIYESTKIYMRALNLICNYKNCFYDKDYNEWNHFITQVLSSYNSEKNLAKNIVILKVRQKNEEFKIKGQINYDNDKIKIFWNNQIMNSTRFDEHNVNFIDLKNFIIINKTKNYCIKKNNIGIISKGESIYRQKSTKLITSELSESEWWIMISTVTGVGTIMFIIGFFAVYIVYTNIRGPQIKTSTRIQDVVRDISLRRIGSERQDLSNVYRNTRIANGLQRRDSKNSIKSNFSDKTV